MQSIREIYRIGFGPSSSHTMGPRKAAETFRERFPMAAAYHVTLFGSLAATGKGHMTDTAIFSALAPVEVDLIWKPEEELPLHPDGMHFEALNERNEVVGELYIYSPGGGAIQIEGEPIDLPDNYSMDCIRDILKYCTQSGKTFWEYVEESEELIAIINEADEKILKTVAEKLRMMILNSLLIINDQLVQVIVSVGGTLLKNEDTPETAIQRADELMVQSKRNGRNRVTVNTH